MRHLFLLIIALAAIAIGNALGEETSAWIAHDVESPHQRGETKVFVLTPDDVDSGKHYRVLYVLPVEAGVGKHWGDALAEVEKLDLANKHNVICVYPTFSDLPWYADHPQDERLQQEKYFLHDVLPLIEREYPTQANRDGRLLVGFSKSGWGAWSLLLRHPNKFAAAAAWDAPLMKTKPKYGMGPIVGDDANFQKYRIDHLLADRAEALGDRPRLVLSGYDNFRQHTQDAHDLLDKLEIPHIYRDGPQQRHHWESGWLGATVESLVSLAEQPKTD